MRATNWKLARLVSVTHLFQYWQMCKASCFEDKCAKLAALREKYFSPLQVQHHNISVCNPGSAWIVRKKTIHTHPTLLQIHSSCTSSLQRNCRSTLTKQLPTKQQLPMMQELSAVRIYIKAGASTGLQQICIISLISVPAVTCIQCVM